MRVHTIVVGAGSAGSVVAARLSERSDRDVLLIEAGPDYLPSQLPKDLADGTRNSMIWHDWGFKHRPTAVQYKFPMPRGKVVGGSSAVNTCIALRPLPRDLAEWGLEDWTYEACLPALKAIENDADFTNEWHGNSGPLPVRRHPPNELENWQAALVAGALDAGHPYCADTNDPTTPCGVGPHAMNKVNGRRINAAEAWLTSAVRARDGFTLWADTMVERVLFDKQRVIGVEVMRRGVLQRILADRVVLCAGAIKTPHLLMASGIGPDSELRRLGVTCVVDLPSVGARLLDHPGFAMFCRPRTLRSANPWGSLIQVALRYSSSSGDLPHDMQMQVGSFYSFPGISLPGVSIMGIIGKPKGAGTLRWRSLSEPPTIDSSMLALPQDLDRGAEAMAIGYELIQGPAMSALAAPMWPSARVLADRDAIREWIPRATDSGYHPCGTVPMGAQDDPRAATDSRGRVRDTDGLYVADASLMPTIPTGNIHLPTLMIGEKIGCWLRDQSH